MCVCVYIYSWLVMLTIYNIHFTITATIAAVAADTCANNLPLDVSRCPQCGKLFRGPRSSISLQEHITNIHAAVAPNTKFGQSTSPSTTVPSFKLSMFGTFDNDLCMVCPKCNLTFDRKEDFEKHQLVHMPSPVQVCWLTITTLAISITNLYILLSLFLIDNTAYWR